MITAKDGEVVRRSRYGLHTDAVVLHCPGPLRHPSDPVHPQWEQAQAAFFKDQAVSLYAENDPDLTIITYNSQSESSLLERCAEHLGLDVVVLGRWLDDWRWEYKITLVRDYLRSIQPTAYVMCLDAFDTLLLAGAREILDRFHRTSAGVLFGSTASDWPPSAIHRHFEDAVGTGAAPEHRHLNASYIGRTGDVLDGLDEIADAIESGASWAQTPAGFDDQLAWRELHRRRHPRFMIDTRCTVFSRFDQFR